MKKSALKLAGLSAVVWMTVSACSKENNDPVDDMVVAKPVVTELTFACDDYSLKNRLVDAMRASILDAALLKIANLPESQLQDMETKVRQQLMNVGIELGKVTNVDDGCLADVQITPAADSTQGRIIAQGIHYKIVDGKAVLDDPENETFVLVAESVIMQAQSVGFIQPEASAAAVPAKLQVVERQAPESDEAEQLAEPEQKPKKAESSKLASDAKKPQPEKVKSTASADSKPKAAKSEKAESADESAKPKKSSESAAHKSEAKPEKQTAKPASKESAKPAQEQHGNKITVVESNETY